MKLRDPKARNGVDGRPDGYVEVHGDLVPVESGEFSHPEITREWAEQYAEREGVSVSTVLVDEATEDATGGVCGATMSDGSTCERPADECPYH